MSSRKDIADGVFDAIVRAYTLYACMKIAAFFILAVIAGIIVLVKP